MISESIRHTRRRNGHSMRDPARYVGYKDEILARRQQVLSITAQSKIKGDYSESLLRELFSRHIPNKYKIAHGLIFDEKHSKISRECDIIVYDQSVKPFFSAPSNDLVIVSPDAVKIVVQVKSNLTSKTLGDAICNLRSVKALDNRTMGWVIGFSSSLLLKTLYLNAWKSKETIQFLNALETRTKTENPELLESQIVFIIELMRFLFRDQGCAQIRNFTIHVGDNGSARLETDWDERRVRGILSDIYSLGFWSLYKARAADGNCGTS